MEKVLAAQKNVEQAEEAQPKEKPAVSETNESNPRESGGGAKDEAEWPKEAPDVFKVKLACSNGDVLIECHKDWAPLGVQRFYDLVRAGFYKEARFFRVMPGFMAQIGMAADPQMNEKWQKRIKDDEVKQSNVPGMVTFATSGKDSRTTQFFINTGNSQYLDGQGFAPFAKVVEGMETVKHINAEYGERPNQGMIRMQGNTYLKQFFPRLDYIKTATLVK